MTELATSRLEAMNCGLLAADGLLLAAGWEQVIIALVALGIWAINQFLGQRNKPVPPARNNPPQPRPGQPAGGGQKGLLDEVEQFLKDARKQMERQQQPQQQTQPKRIQPPPMPQQPRKQKTQAAKAKQKPRPQQARPLAESRPLDDVDRGSSVAEHVREHIGTDRFDTSGFDERAGKLSHLQQTIDQDIGAHVRSVFDHQVGTMTTGSALSGPTVESSGPTPAELLVAMLRDPQGMRNAVVLQEVLRPPVERW
jgi:hypothetical protein